MFRLKITMLVLGLLLTAALGVNALLSGVESTTTAQHTADAGHNYLVYQQIKALRDVQMKDVAVALSRSEVAAYMGVMQDFRKRLLATEADVYRRHGGSPTDEEAKATRAAAIRERHAEILDDVSAALVERLGRYPQARIAADLRDTVRDGLVACLSVGVNNCVHRFGYFPLREVITEMIPGERFGIEPDLVILADASGIGIADADRSGWSAQDAFGDSVSIVNDVRAERVLRDVVQLQNRDDYYFATAAPIFEGGVFRGSVLVGVTIDADLAATESEILGAGIAYVENRTIIQSNLERNDAIEVRHNLQGVGDEIGTAPRVRNLETDRLVAQFIPLTGNHSNMGVRAIVVTNKARATASFGDMRLWIWVGAIILALASLLVLVRWWFVFEQPFVKLDQGIHDVTDGNRAFVFEVDTKETMWTTLANGLNSMTSALTGRDIHLESGEWDISLLPEIEGGAEAAALASDDETTTL